MSDNAFKILVIGDVMIDEYVFVSHERNSPEADIAVLDEHSRSYKLGGAANVARNLKAMGAEPMLVSICGKDMPGDQLKSLLNSENIAHQLIEDNERPTTLKTRFTDKEYKQFFRLDRENKSPVFFEMIGKIKAIIDEQCSENEPDAIIIQDYNKGLLTRDLITYIQEISRNSDIPLFVDPKKDNFELLSDCDFFKPNLSEIKEYLGSEEIQTTDELLNTASNSLNKAKNLIITLGSEGMYYKNAEFEARIPAWKLENPDVSGAGDTVISALCIHHLMGHSLEENADFSNKAGAISCSKKSVSVVNLGEIDEFGAKKA